MDQRVQQALRRALGEMMQQFGDLTGEIPPALGEADMAMRDSAQRSWAPGDDKAPPSPSSRRSRRCRRALARWAARLAKQFGRGQQGGEPGDGDSVRRPRGRWA